MNLVALQGTAALAAAATSGVAAAFWLWASMTRLPPFANIGSSSSANLLGPIEQALKASARRNAIAAGFSFAAAVAAAVAFWAQAKLTGIL